MKLCQVRSSTTTGTAANTDTMTWKKDKKDYTTLWTASNKTYSHMSIIVIITWWEQQLNDAQSWKAGLWGGQLISSLTIGGNNALTFVVLHIVGRLHCLCLQSALLSHFHQYTDLQSNNRATVTSSQQIHFKLSFSLSPSQVIHLLWWHCVDCPSDKF